MFTFTLANGMNWVLNTLRNHSGFIGSQNDDDLVPFALHLALDVLGASFAAVLSSFLKESSSHPLLQDLVCLDKSDIKQRKVKDGMLNYDVKLGDTRICEQLQLHPDCAINFITQEPSIISVKGLRNKGQTCYANSVFQALASLTPLCKYLQQLQRNKANILGEELYQTMQYVNGHTFENRPKRQILHLMLATNSPIRYGDPSKVMDIVARHHSQFKSRTSMFAGTSEQQDAHEFLIALLDVLSSEDHDTLSSNMSLVGVVNDHHDEEIVSLLHNKLHKLDKNKKQICNEDNLRERSDREGGKQDDATMLRMNNHNCGNDPYMLFTSKICDVTDPQSNSTPYPFDGWIGSTIKCHSCHHVRPIRSAPFVALSVSLGNNTYPSCTIEDSLLIEYGGFQTAERVSDVLCLACAIQKKLQEHREEEFILKGAISSINRRKRSAKQQQNEKHEDLICLVKETEKIRHVATQLRSIDPDADEELCDNHKSFMGEFELIGIEDKSSSKLQPIRGDAWKVSFIMRPPKVLCVHIQRKHFDSRSGQMVKIRRQINFSELMDLTDFNAFCQQRKRTDHRVQYKLMSVIEHQGGAFDGHYQTYRRTNGNDESNNSWVLVSDQSVSPRSWNDVKSCQAYMLFYVAL